MIITSIVTKHSKNGAEAIEAQMDRTRTTEQVFTQGPGEGECHLEAEPKDETRDTHQIYHAGSSIFISFHPLRSFFYC